jgi:hypothetical protein
MRQPHAFATLSSPVISTDLLEHFAVLRDPPEMIEGAVGPIEPPPVVLTIVERPRPPTSSLGLDMAHALRVLALDEVCAWLIPGAEGVCLASWDRRMSSGSRDPTGDRTGWSLFSGPIDGAIRGLYVNRMGAVRAGVTVFRAVGLVPDDVIEVTRSSVAGTDEQIPIRNNVWTISQEPPDSVVTLHWRTLETRRVRVEPPRAAWQVGLQ